MRTSTSLAYASPPSPRKLAFKRRRLNHTVDPGSQPSRALADNSNFAPTLNASSVSLCTKLSCLTCHRTLSAMWLGMAGPSVCSRCSAPTCQICARTCTSYTRPLSLPPTPALTRSPSPATQVNTAVSPKRTALSLSYATMNCDTSVALVLPPISSIKRKKAPIDKEDLDSDLGGNAGRDSYDAVSAHGDNTESIVIPGCGRVVCRACCVEGVPNDGKLCVDCFTLV